MSVNEQTVSILNMLRINWTMEDIKGWFGEETDHVDYNQHILMVLKAIETKYYKDREEINREIRELKTQIDVIKKELPENYDGDMWKDLKVQEYYDKVALAKDINSKIALNKMIQEGIQDRINAIENEAESMKDKAKVRYADQRQDIKDIIEMAKGKIVNANNSIAGLGAELEKNINEYHTLHDYSMAELEREYEAKKAAIEKKLRDRIEEAKGNAKEDEENFKEIIIVQQNKISAKEQELLNVDALEEQEIKGIDEKKASKIEVEQSKVGIAAEFLQNNKEVEVLPLQQEANKVANMQSYLRQWAMIVDIRDNKLPDKERYSALLTERIEKARSLPGELLKTAQVPIEDISVDSSGRIRIKSTLIDGLSDGEKQELAMKIAVWKAQQAELKIICLNGWEALNKSERDKIVKNMLRDDFQYFITTVDDSDDGQFHITKLAKAE
jgi:hypothetical protein